MSAHRWVRRMWSGGGGIPAGVARAVLLPAEWLFGAAVRWRDFSFRRTGRSVLRASVPVVSVGNVSVGGTGKTPVASWVIRTLQRQGASPALVARGYGQDELLLHRRWTPGIPVIADPDRHAGVERAVREGATVAVLDDGFQHRRLARNLDVVLVGAEEGLPGPLLPRGPFREPARALRRAQAVIVTRKEASAERAHGLMRQVRELAPEAVVGQVHLRPGELTPLVGGTQDQAASPPVATTTDPPGVARPESVTWGIQSLDLDVGLLKSFRDHHDFTEDDVAALMEEAGSRPVVVTEKDAVKWERIEAARTGEVWVLRQEVHWEEGREAVEALLEGVLKETIE